MPILPVTQFVPEIAHTRRGIKASSARLARLIEPMAGVLAVAVLIEMLLFRTFSRTGIYLLHDDTPRWVYTTYRSALWLGETMYNFSALLVMVLMLTGIVFMLSQPKTFGRALPVLIAALLVWSIGLIFVSNGPVLSVAYLALSSATMISAIAVIWREARWPVRATSVMLGASFLCVYYFETVAPLRLAGFTFADHGIGVFQLGEALTGIGIVAAFWAWGRTRKLRLILPPLLATALMVGGYIGGPERFPLISTWSMGVIMSLPAYVYAAGIFLIGVTLLKLLTSGRRTVAFALLFLLLTHRMLPLTYFNLLLIAGFMLLALGAIERGKLAAPSRESTATEPVYIG